MTCTHTHNTTHTVIGRSQMTHTWNEKTHFHHPALIRIPYIMLLIILPRIQVDTGRVPTYIKCG